MSTPNTNAPSIAIQSIAGAAPGENIYRARLHYMKSYRVTPPDPDVHRDLEHGWMFPILIGIDRLLYHRWDYWAACQQYLNYLPDKPIPQMPFLMSPEPTTLKMLTASLNCITGHGSWQTWGSSTYFRFFLEWLLYGLGHPQHRTLPEEHNELQGASDRLYQVFSLDLMLLNPYDYFATLLEETAYGRGQSFFATPMPIVKFMTSMVMDLTGKQEPAGVEGKIDTEDSRLARVLDPCMGTGRFPLMASNHSLRLLMVDIDPTLCLAALVNGYLYAPWMACPIWWLEPELYALSVAEPEPHSANPGPIGNFNSLMPNNHPAGYWPAGYEGKSESTPGEPPVYNAKATKEAEKRAQRTAKEEAKREAAEAKPTTKNAAVLPFDVAALSDAAAVQAPPHIQEQVGETEHDPEGIGKFGPILKRRKRREVDPAQANLFEAE